MRTDIAVVGENIIPLKSGISFTALDKENEDRS